MSRRRLTAQAVAPSVYPMPDSDYISGEEAAALIGVSKRTVERWANDAAKDLHVSHAPGGKQLYLRVDVERLANEHQAGEAARARAAQFTPQRPAEIVPAGEMLDYLRDRDSQIERLNQQLISAAAQIGSLQTQLEQRLLPADEQHIRQALAEAEARAGVLEQEAEQLREELERARRPWWRRLLG